MIQGLHKGECDMLTKEFLGNINSEIDRLNGII